MRFEIQGNEVYASTGGRDHQSDQSYLIFLHGAGASHLVWSQQSRSFAYGGYNVLALDFPGHNLSGGDALSSVEAQCEWLVSVMDQFNLAKAAVVGHSQGGLVCLDLAAKHPERVEKAVFVATAAAIPVGDPLIANAEGAEHLAKSSMTAWGLGPDAHHFDNTVPGVSLAGTGLRSMDLNPQGAVASDLKACVAFAGGLDKASSIQCPTMTVLAGKDKMTPLKFGMKLADALPDNKLHVLKGSGHTIPGERPHELNEFLRVFLAN